MSARTTIHETNFHFPGQTGFYRGKVREVYYVDPYVILIASDRISAFDHILPRRIPFKGQVLNQLSAYFLSATGAAVPNWYLGSPHPQVSIGYRCEPIKLEMVIRGYLTGHAWRIYRDGGRTICGVHMPDGMKENDPFPKPIITPSTKAEEGHDEDISETEILQNGIVSPVLWAQLTASAHKLFQIGTAMAAERGLILVDTKYEFGIFNGQLYVMDEIHTPDSSRYFLLEEYAERQQAGLPQTQLSKEFVREWLMDFGFQGKEGQLMPHMGDNIVEEISRKYIELYERVTGQSFVPHESAAPLADIEAAVTDWLSNRERIG